MVYIYDSYVCSIQQTGMIYQKNPSLLLIFDYTSVRLQPLCCILPPKLIYRKDHSLLSRFGLNFLEVAVQCKSENLLSVQFHPHL